MLTAVHCSLCGCRHGAAASTPSTRGFTPPQMTSPQAADHHYHPPAAQVDHRQSQPDTPSHSVAWPRRHVTAQPGYDSAADRNGPKPEVAGAGKNWNEHNVAYGGRQADTSHGGAWTSFPANSEQTTYYDDQPVTVSSAVEDTVQSSPAFQPPPAPPLPSTILNPGKPFSTIPRPAAVGAQAKTGLPAVKVYTLVGDACRGPWRTRSDVVDIDRPAEMWLTLLAALAAGQTDRRTDGRTDTRPMHYAVTCHQRTAPAQPAYVSALRSE